jgi:hypothetical protein
MGIALASLLLARGMSTAASHDYSPGPILSVVVVKFD